MEQAEEGVEAAKAALAEANDEVSKATAFLRLDKAKKALAKAKERLERDAIARADTKVEALIRRALEENWPFKRLEAARKRLIEEGRVGSNSPGADVAAPAPGAPLFKSEATKLVLYRSRIATARAEARQELALMLRGLLAVLEDGATSAAGVPGDNVVAGVIRE